ncbi:MAG: nucleoside hydrolase [Bacteroidales bacterium]|nr:nucleoside hydrolase [Bacteroidales bacterium]
MGFFGRLKKEIWKVIRAILVIGIIVSIVITAVTYGKKIARPDNVSVIIDSDSGNEFDDLYAITLALIDPKIDVIGLTSAQWYNHPRGGDSSVYESQRINEELLKLNDRFDIPHPLGAAGPTGFWGDVKPIPSAAAAFIREEVAKLGFKEKLNVVTLGAPTNLATAILQDTTIISKIRWYAMGLRYDDREQVWNKNEFNTRNDLDAMDYLLNREGLETHIMTATTSKKYTFDRTETFDMLSSRAPKYTYLVDRWKTLYPEHRSWIMWDVALIHAIMNPDLVTEKDIWTPPENLRRRVFVYTWLDDVKMRREFRKLVRKDLNDISSDVE